MPPPQDRYEVNLQLVTVAGTKCTMQANLSHCEDVAELEDDILCFRPAVSDLEVFGCELELLDLREQQPLSEAFRTVLLQRPQLQIVVRPCMVEGHSIWHFQADGKEGYPKAVRVPANPRGEIADRAFYATPSIRHVEVATGIIGIAAWQSCQQLQIVKLPSSVVSLAEGTFMGCYVLRKVAAAGCVHCGQKGVCRVLFPRQRWGQSRNRGQQRPGTRHSLADVLSRVASRLQLSPLIWIVLTNHEHCLKAHSVEQALNSCACRMTFTTSGRGSVKIAKVWWKSTL